MPQPHLVLLVSGEGDERGKITYGLNLAGRLGCEVKILHFNDPHAGSGGMALVDYGQVLDENQLEHYVDRIAESNYSQTTQFQVLKGEAQKALGKATVGAELVIVDHIPGTWLERFVGLGEDWRLVEAASCPVLFYKDTELS